jgi:hypothetical protein
MLQDAALRRQHHFVLRAVAYGPRSTGRVWTGKGTDSACDRYRGSAVIGKIAAAQRGGR